MLGSASGPIFVPPLYGVPAVLTNWWPPGMRPWHASDIFVPKLPRRSVDGRYLTLTETLSEPLAALAAIFSAAMPTSSRNLCRIIRRDLRRPPDAVPPGDLPCVTQATRRTDLKG
jgi:hypothetical protein